MKVLHIITDLNQGGAESMLHSLIANHGRGSTLPVVISLTSIGVLGAKIADEGFEVHALNFSRRIPNPFLFLKLIKLIIRINPDIVQTWMYHADFVGGCIARLIGFRNVFWSIHHNSLSYKNDKVRTLIVAKLCAYLSYIVPRRIFVCAESARLLHVKFGYNRDILEVIPNGFDSEKYRYNEAARTMLRNEVGIPHNSMLVGLVARYHGIKNHEGFIQAAKMLLSKMKNVHFLLVGKGVDHNNSDLVATIGTDNSRSNFHLLGERSDIPYILSSLDLLASSSHSEAFPIVIGEAMLCNVPCVVTDTGDSSLIVSSYGRVVPVGDMESLASEMHSMLTQPASHRLRCGEMGRRHVIEKYEIKNIVKQFESAYAAGCVS